MARALDPYFSESLLDPELSSTEEADPREVLLALLSRLPLESERSCLRPTSMLVFGVGGSNIGFKLLKLDEWLEPETINVGISGYL